MSTTRTRSLAAVAALSLTVFLGACGSSDSGSSDSGSSSTTSSDSSKAAAGAKHKVGDEVELAAVAKDTAAAMKAKKSYTFTAKGGAGDMSGAASTGDSTSMKIDTEMEGQKTSILIVDGAMYLEGMEGLEAGKKYLKIDASGDDPISKMMAPALSQMTESLDPTAGLQALQGVKSKVVEVKDGATTYETTVSVEQQKEMAKKQLEKMGMGDQQIPASAVSGPMTIRQTIDSDNLPSVVEVKGGAAEMMTITYADWGKAVEIAAPPASEVGTFDLGKLPTG